MLRDKITPPSGTLLNHIFFYISKTACVSDGDCRSNRPVGSSICDFTSDTIYERKTCSIGACVCRDEYEVTTDGCTPIKQLTVGDRCRNEPQERYPFGAFCKTPQNVVTCLENMEFSATSQPPGCRYILPVRSFGDVCNSRVWCDSTLGLECSRVSQKCSCMGDSAIWRDGRCTYERFFGDPCVRDQDCSDPGGLTSVGMICFRSRCVCGPGYIVRVLAVKNPPMISDFDRSNKITYRLMCLNDSKSLEMCPLFYSFLLHFSDFCTRRTRQHLQHDTRQFSSLGGSFSFQSNPFLLA